MGRPRKITIDQILDLGKKNLSASEMAQALDVDPSTIYRCLQRNNLRLEKAYLVVADNDQPLTDPARMN